MDISFNRLYFNSIEFWVWFIYEPEREIKRAGDLMIATVNINKLEIGES